MWLPELSDGAAHNLNNLPIVIAGQRGRLPEDRPGRQRRGQRHPGDRQQRQLLRDSGGTIGNTGSSGGNLPINKLYVTLMNAVGCTERPTAAR